MTKIPEFIKCICGDWMVKFTRIKNKSARYMCNSCDRIVTLKSQNA